MKRHTVVMGLLSVLAMGGFLFGEDKSDFDFMNLIGNWEGEGSFLIPKTGVSLDIEGTGVFEYDSLNNRVRTSMQGTKMLLTYADSGYLYYHPETDSVSWEVWDTWGRHALYWGVVENGVLRADRLFKNRNYRVSVFFPHPDTLDFRLTRRQSDGGEEDQATFLLWKTGE